MKNQRLRKIQKILMSTLRAIAVQKSQKRHHIGAFFANGGD
jgi:hypothetical protein